jgi:hypothetical protein
MQDRDAGRARHAEPMGEARRVAADGRSTADRLSAAGAPSPSEPIRGELLSLAASMGNASFARWIRGTGEPLPTRPDGVKFAESGLAGVVARSVAPHRSAPVCTPRATVGRPILARVTTHSFNNFLALANTPQLNSVAARLQTYAGKLTTMNVRVTLDPNSPLAVTGAYWDSKDKQIILRTAHDVFGQLNAQQQQEAFDNLIWEARNAYSDNVLSQARTLKTKISPAGPMKYGWATIDAEMLTRALYLTDIREALRARIAQVAGAQTDAQLANADLTDRGKRDILEWMHWLRQAATPPTGPPAPISNWQPPDKAAYITARMRHGGATPHGGGMAYGSAELYALAAVENWPEDAVKEKLARVMLYAFGIRATEETLPVALPKVVSETNQRFGALGGFGRRTSSSARTYGSPMWTPGTTISCWRRSSRRSLLSSSRESKPRYSRTRWTG